MNKINIYNSFFSSTFRYVQIMFNFYLAFFCDLIGGEKRNM